MALAAAVRPGSRERMPNKAPRLQEPRISENSASVLNAVPSERRLSEDIRNHQVDPMPLYGRDPPIRRWQEMSAIGGEADLPMSYLDIRV